MDKKEMYMCHVQQRDDKGDCVEGLPERRRTMKEEKEEEEEEKDV